MSDFGFLAGAALIVLAIVSPLAYCTAHVDGPVRANDLHLACIKARGEWKSLGWGPYTCSFPKGEPAN